MKRMTEARFFHNLASRFYSAVDGIGELAIFKPSGPFELFCPNEKFAELMFGDNPICCFDWDTGEDLLTEYMEKTGKNVQDYNPYRATEKQGLFHLASEDEVRKYGFREWTSKTGPDFSEADQKLVDNFIANPTQSTLYAMFFKTHEFFHNFNGHCYTVAEGRYLYPVVDKFKNGDVGISWQALGFIYSEDGNLPLFLLDSSTDKKKEVSTK